MFDVNFDPTTLKAEGLKGLSKGAVLELAAALLVQLTAQGTQLSAQHAALQAKDEHIARRDREIKFKDTKIERITFELARLKAWKFGARTERMNAEQRQLFEETVAEDEASLQAQLEALQGASVPSTPLATDTTRRPRRQPLPEQLRRVEHRHEPENTTCPSPGCGQAMVRIGEDVSERLDIVPAEFFVHRHIRGKWACKCCQVLVQEPAAPQIIDKGMPTAGLLAHTLVSRFVDHLPYYRQEQINARAGVHTPRSTLAAWSGAAGASLQPLFDAHRAFVLGAQVLHADETPVRMLDPGAGKTTKAYVWAYARGEHDAIPGVVYDFCVGRGAKYPTAFLHGWAGTITCDDYKGYDAVFRLEGRTEAGCLAHARRKFDELAKAHASPVAAQAIERIAWLYRIEQEAREMTAADRLALRQQLAQPLWNELYVWLRLEKYTCRRRRRHRSRARLQPQALGRTGSLPARRRGQHRQQSHRAADAALGDGQKGMALCRQRTGRPARGDGDESGAVRQAQWARAVGLPHGCAGTVVGASEQPDRGAIAAPLGQPRLTLSRWDGWTLTERLLARVVQFFGAAQAHHGYLFANARGTRVKLLVHDGFGVWCAARRLNAGRFVWPGPTNTTPLLSLTPAQFDALVCPATAIEWLG